MSSPTPSPAPGSAASGSTASDIDFSKLPEDRPLAPLPLGATLKGVFTCVWASAPVLGRLAALPLLLSFFMGAAVHFLGDGLFTVVIMADLYLSVWFCCAVQRVILLGPDSATPLPLWASRDIRYLMKALGLFGFIFLASLPVNMALAPQPGGMDINFENILPMIFAMSAVALIVGCALGLVLPAASVGTGYGYGRAFRESLAVLPVLILMFLLLILPVDALMLGANILLNELEMATSLTVPGLAVAAAGKYLSFAWASAAFAYVFAKRTRFWEETA